MTQLVVPTFVWALLFTVISGCGVTAAPEGSSEANTDSARTELRDLSRFFGDLDGTFVLLDAQTGDMVVYNADRARTRFLPASTFKIPNTLIALETGVADGPDFALSRDRSLAPSADWWPASWLQDHTLETALPASVVWYYQELARRIGADRMQTMLRQFDYGNADISGGIDRFWLTGGLRISAVEQTDFLQRFYHGRLGASNGNTQAVKDALRLEATEAYVLSGKTGWAGLGEEEPDVGWLVGFLERGDDVYFYALNIEIRTNADAAERMRITREVLHHLGLTNQE